MALTLLERNTELLRRIQRPDGINEQIRAIFINGKRQQLIHGTDRMGIPFQPLAASTMKHHEGSSTPLVPMGEMSQVVQRYEVTVTAEPTRLVVRGSWPGLDWIKYHIAGGRHLPRRDPSGFREDDKREAIKRWREWLFQ